MGHIGKDVSCKNALFIHETALLYGKITIGDDVSIFPHVVMRSEMHEIRIGARTNIQDFVMIHVGDFKPTIVGEDCSITHHATLHGCEIGDKCLVGINATVMDGAKIGDNSIIAGHAIVTEGAEFPSCSIIAGVPAKRVGEHNGHKRILLNSHFYRLIAGNYTKGLERLTDKQVEELLKEATY